ncbi:MAG: hypothetical protein AAFX09_01675 [Pseudomonadota bacterium]
MLTRRAFTLSLSAAAGLGAGARAEQARDRLALWRNADGPHLRGAVFAQRRVYQQLDGPTFLGPGLVGPPVSDQALDALADLGANLAVWSGPGPFSEAKPHRPDPAIEDHIAAWLETCRQRGLFTVLALRSGPGRSAFAFNRDEDWYPRELLDESVWRDRSKQEAWAQMVAWMLARFGDHPACAGVLAMVEPNAETVGEPGVWPGFAQGIATACAPVRVAAPLLLSPSGWADARRADEIAPVLTDDVGLVSHDWSPHAYTHSGGSRPSSADIAAPNTKTPAWACLEFGATASASDRAHFLRERIVSLEGAGAGWAAWRWTSGWSVYEAQENAMNLARDPQAVAVLREAFAQNTARPA